MCGIAGIMFKDKRMQRSTGQALIDMLDGCQHRGPDSTGFALYRSAESGHLRLRFFVGEGDEAGRAVDDIRAALERHGARIVEDQLVGNNYRCTVSFSGDLQQLAYDMEHAAVEVPKRLRSPIISATASPRPPWLHLWHRSTKRT